MVVSLPVELVHFVEQEGKTGTKVHSCYLVLLALFHMQMEFRDIKVNKLQFFMTVTAQTYHWFCWFALPFYSLEKKQGSKSVLLR